MMQPLERIEKLRPVIMLDASDFDLDICNRLLSTHASCGRETMTPIRARHADLINASLEEDTDHDLLLCPVEKICPSDITTGMFLMHHDYVGKVIKVVRHEAFPYKKADDEPWIYVFYLEYVYGSLDTFKYFRSRINNGTHLGCYSSFSGNRLADFYPVTEA